jgi:hypothetical protein
MTLALPTGYTLNAQGQPVAPTAAPAAPLYAPNAQPPSSTGMTGQISNTTLPTSLPQTKVDPYANQNQPGAAERYYNQSAGTYGSDYGAQYTQDALKSFATNGVPAGGNAQQSVFGSFDSSFGDQNASNSSAISNAYGDNGAAIASQQQGYLANLASANQALGAQRSGLSAIGAAGSSAAQGYTNTANNVAQVGSSSAASERAGIDNTYLTDSRVGAIQQGNIQQVYADSQRAIQQEQQALYQAYQTGQMTRDELSLNLQRVQASGQQSLEAQLRNYDLTSNDRDIAAWQGSGAEQRLVGQEGAATSDLQAAIARLAGQGQDAFGYGVAGYNNLIGSRNTALSRETANLDRLLAARPELQNDAGLGLYYDNAQRRATETINRTLGARGAYGSSAADDQIAESTVNLNAERANREADYNLKRSAENRAWEDTIGGQTHNLTGSTLGYDTLTQGALNDILKTKAGYDTAGLQGSTALGDLRLGFGKAESDLGVANRQLGLGYDQLKGLLTNNIAENRLGYDTLQSKNVADKADSALGFSRLGVDAAHGISDTSRGFDTINSNNVNSYADNRLGFAKAENDALHNLSSTNLGFQTLGADVQNNAAKNSLGFADLGERALDDLSGRTLGFNTLDANTQNNIAQNTYAKNALNVNSTLTSNAQRLQQDQLRSSTAQGIDANLLANNRLGLDYTTAMGDLAQTQDSIDIQNRNAKLQAAIAAQNAERTRTQDAFQNQFDVASSLSGIMGQTYSGMSSADMQLLLQQLGLQTGVGAEGYAQATRNTNVAQQDDQAEQDRLAAAAKAFTQLYGGGRTTSAMAGE